MKLKTSIAAAALLLSELSSGQTTGSFNTNINFQSQQRQLSLFVPGNYNAANKYKLMVCLHGLGMTSSSFRDAIVGPMGWPSAMPNTIFICPEASDPNNDFYATPGSEEIVQQSVTYAMVNYHIDTANVVLQGFSLGGRAALRYGLSHPAMFRGMLLNSPAAQGIKEAISQNSLYNYTYANAPGIPAFVTVGSTDIQYLNVVDTLHHQLLLNDGKTKMVTYAGLGHAIPAIGQMSGFLSFFESPGNALYDLELVRIYAPDRTCETSVNPVLLIRNSGRNSLSSAKIHYAIGNTSADYTWTGNLPPFQHAVVNLPAMALAPGNQNFVANITQLNGGIQDTVVTNNTLTVPITRITAGMPLPITEGFETASFPPNNWLVHPSGEWFSPYTVDQTVSRSGSASLSAFNSILLFENSGRKEELLSPVMNLSSGFNPSLSFDVAYNYHQYTAPYVTVTTNLADTLEVLVSADCGESYQSVYKKGGTQLSTFANPIVNALSPSAGIATPGNTNWRNETISLTSFASSTNAVVKFRYTSGLGGSIHLDNISVNNGSATGIHELSPTAFNVYPNPAKDQLMVESATQKIEKLELLDVSGKPLTIFSPKMANSGQFQIDLSAMSNGIYLLKVYTTNGIGIKKFAVSK